jgi:dephospho-CoA kinase
VYVIGLTGNIAAGKSTVAAMLAELGAEVIDADALTHELMVPGAPVNDAIVARFGADMRLPDGAIDRRRLGALVFADPAALADLEAIVHPAVLAETARRLAACTRPVAVVEAIKVIEAGMAADYDAVWVVTADRDTRSSVWCPPARLSEAEAALRARRQSPVEEKWTTPASSSTTAAHCGQHLGPRVRDAGQVIPAVAGIPATAAIPAAVAASADGCRLAFVARASPASVRRPGPWPWPWPLSCCGLGRGESLTLRIWPAWPPPLPPWPPSASGSSETETY